MHEREAHIVAHRVKAPDFVDRNLIFFAKAPGDIDHARGDVQVKGRTSSSKLGPFGERFEMIDRFACFDFDDRLQASAAIQRVEHQVGVNGRRTGANRDVLFGSRVDPGIVFTPVLCLQQPDNTIVLELFADRPHQDRAHLAPPNYWINAVVNP
jgi:hypothetical protein